MAGACCNQILCLTCVPTGSIGVVYRCNQAVGTRGDGPSCICFPFETIGPVDIRIQQLNVDTDTKTVDNVTCKVVTAIQFQVDAEKAIDAVTKLNNAPVQMSAYVDDVVRSTLPTMTLDQAYGAKDQMANAIKTSLSESMAPFGYHIVKALVTDLKPDQKVLEAMNEINAQRRLREAAKEKAEAEKDIMIKQSEAEAEAKYLSGVGVARMRKAISEGFAESIESLKTGGLSGQEVVHMMLVTQYMDTLRAGMDNPKGATLIVPHGPSTLDMEAQVRQGFIAAKQMERGIFS
eukprot:CAMPEP_0185768328 /NCGR_PEP_ID=MMETSP1174-20130828/49033_1 /TAXON_ID=35687 /ORGANISM="Dictyocha speculum, Strain CCMP1381" /LENGTH=290 /DNA_ID=CAMNT_0028452967 /DNA_START=10 /DNA_END=882 /DNA_ORIENTATION=+